MDANEIDQLAEAMIQKQNEAQAKREAEAHALAAAEAQKAEAQAEKDRIAAERKAAKDAAIQAEQDRIAEEKRLRIEAVLSSLVGDVFVDSDGAEHRVVGSVHEGVDTVSRDRDGGTVGNWRRGRGDVEVVATWKKK